MKKRSLRNGAIVMVTLGALTGVGTMVANAATGPGGDPRGGQAADRGGDRDVPRDPGASPSPFDPRATPSFDPDANPSFDPSATPPGQAANDEACVAVRVAGVQQAGDGRLCTVVETDGRRIERVRVTLTVPDGACQGEVILQASTGQGDVRTQRADCATTGRATATFDTGAQVADGSEVCGILAADDRLSSARACVRVTA